MSIALVSPTAPDIIDLVRLCNGVNILALIRKEPLDN